MKMERDKPVYSGNLFVPAAGKILLKKSLQQKYCKLFKSSKFGVERLEIYDSVDSTKQTPSRIITLQDCIKINPNSSTYFSVTTKSGVHEFGTITTSSMSEWLNAFQTVAFPDECSKITSIEEDNDLYCPSGEAVFNVKLHSSPASIRCGLEAKSYLLVLTNNDAQLRSCHDNRLLYSWPYCFIRKYGYKSDKFTFEAGRKCESGEGIFYLEHSDQQAIFRCFASKIKSKKKLLNSDTFPSIHDMDNSFQAALSMEARSRSPLPLSLTLSTHMRDNEPNLLSKSHLPPDKEDVSLTKLIPHVRPKPIKPARKNIPAQDVSSKSLYESVNKYDEIEYRSDAWKTMGINEVNHLESESVEAEDEYSSWGNLKKTQNMKVPLIQAPKVITEVKTQKDYDKLNFFGSTSKNNNNPSSYKQVKVSSNDLSFQPPSFNEYDEVEVDPKTKSISLIVKENTVKVGEIHINHQMCHNEPYAVVSKPKRV